MKDYRKIAEDSVRLLNQKWKVVAILANKKPVSIATNNPNKTHPSTSTKEPGRTLHAEIRCIRNAPKAKVLGGTLYVFRIDHKGELRMAKPCKICEMEIQRSGIKHIYYSKNDFELSELKL